MRKTIIISLLMGASLSSAGAKELKVFILAGQSNMVGYGKTEMGRVPGHEEQNPGKAIKGGVGSLRYFVKQNEGLYGAKGKTSLVDASGAWIKRKDVYIHSTTEHGDQKGPLTIGYGKGNWIGPEFGFGHMIGNASKGPVLIIKTAWGGKDLAIDFRPPSSGPIKDTSLRKHKPEDVGRFYRLMLAKVNEVMGSIDTEFPELKGYKPRIVGFGWHQGWNDGGDENMVAQYEKNMVNFITDVRKDLGVKDLPFVIASSGMIGPKGKGRRANLCDIQMAVGDPKKHPEFKGTVASVEARAYYRSHLKSPSNFGFHWHHNGESQFLIGQGMGEAMLKLLSK